MPQLKSIKVLLELMEQTVHITYVTLPLSHSLRSTVCVFRPTNWIYQKRRTEKKLKQNEKKKRNTTHGGEEKEKRSRRKKSKHLSLPENRDDHHFHRINKSNGK